MSTIKVNKIENVSTTNGGIEVNTSGHVTVDGVQMPTAGPLSNRNLIINGAMEVAQRGTGNFPIGDSSYPVDRFLFANSGSGFTGGANGTQSTTAPAGFVNSFEMDVTTADTSLTSDSQAKIEYRVEGLDAGRLNWGTANPQTVTLSFYIKSNLTGETAVAFVNQNNNRSYVATFNINAANTWERKEITVTGPTDGSWNTNNNIGLRLRWGSFGNNYQTTSTNQWVSTQKMTSTSSINFFSSTDNNLFLTGVQLEVGEKATPFEHRNYGEEFARCQRYFQKFREPRLRGVGGGSTHCNRMGLPLPVTMRNAPTVTSTGTFAWYDGDNVGSINYFTVSYTFPDSIELDSSNSTSNPNAMSGTTTVAQPICVYNSNNVHSGEVSLNAEL